MKTQVTLLFFLLACLFGNDLIAQSLVAKGTIQSENGEALIGASLRSLRSGTYAMTDFDGKFTIKLAYPIDSVEVSYVGYESIFVRLVAGNTTEEASVIQLKEGAILDEIVVTEHHALRDRAVTGGAIASVSSGEKKVHKRKRRKERKAKIFGFAKDARTPPAVASPSFADGVRTTSSSAAADMETMAFSSVEVNAGSLTAGEVNDFSKWELWQDIAKKELAEYQKTWKMQPLRRYSAQIVTEDGVPVIDAEVHLQSGKKVLWKSRTDNTGKAELWSQVFHQHATKERLFIKAIYKGKTYQFNKAKSFQEDLNVLEIPLACDVPNEVDISFVVDATSSMLDEIRYLKAELKDIINKVSDSIPDLNLRTSSVFYRDHTDAYLTKKSDFSKDINTTVNFIKENNAQGGGDFPEAVDEALKVAINELSWNENARARILFLILDAPPHDKEEVKNSLRVLMQTAARKGIRVIPVTCSGIDKSTEYLMRSMALLTNGTYTFLTDDSGIGNAHIKPTTDSYEVEKLNDLIQRLIFQYTYAPTCEEKTDETVASLVDAPTIWEKEKVEKLQFEKPENGPKLKWKYYPNPSKGQITVEINQEIKELFISDVSGKILKRILWNKEKKMRIDLSDLPSGLYLITYEYQPDKWISGKVILQREGTVIRA